MKPVMNRAISQEVIGDRILKHGTRTDILVEIDHEEIIPMDHHNNNKHNNQQSHHTNNHKSTNL